jgi:hypothetical protein
MASDTPTSTTAPDRKRQRSVPTSSRERVDTWWIVGISAVAAGFAHAEPSGWAPADVAITAAFAAVVTLAASRARRWAWLTTAAATFVLAGGDVAWVVVAGCSLALAIAAAVLERRSRAWGALIGAGCIQVLLHLPDRWFHGSSALLVAVVVTPLLVSGYRRARVPERRRVRRVAAATLGVAALAALAFGVAAALAEPDLREGVDQAEEALDLVRDGKTDEASILLVEASASFDHAEGLLTGPLGLPARVLPVLGHQALATAEMARAGADLADVGATTTTTANYDELHLTAGQVDLDRLTSLQQPVAESLAALEVADQRLTTLDDRWLVPVIADPLTRLVDEVTSARSEAALADEALSVAPLLLGADGPQTYLTLLGQPAESRFGGGFIGTWAELQATSGQIDLTDSGTIEDLRNAPPGRDRTLSGPTSYLERYGRYFPAYNLQNIAASPDFPTVRQVASELYPQTGHPAINGALYLDPLGVAALLELSGPVTVPGLVLPLDSAGAAAFLSTDIYEQFPDTAARDALLHGAIEALFDALTTRDLPGPRAIADTLGTAVRGNHLAISVADPAGESFLAGIGANGAFPEPTEDGDLLAIKVANSAPNKLDTYLDRSVAYDVEVDPATGQVQGTARLTLTNTAPATGLPDIVGTNRGLIDGSPGAPPPGTAIVKVSLWSPLLMTSATVDGAVSPMELQEEFGLHVYSTEMTLLPGATAVLETRLTGILGLPYRLVVDHQPLADDGDLTVRVTTPSGWDPGALLGLEPVDGVPQSTRTHAEDAWFEARFDEAD